MKETTKLAQNLKTSGFTLIEVMLYVGILSTFLAAMMTLYAQMIDGSAKQDSQTLVTQNTNRLHHRLSTEIRQAESIQLSGSSDVCLTQAETSRTPIRIYLNNQTIFVGIGGASDCSSESETIALTDDHVLVSELTFTDLSLDESTHIGIETTLEASTQNPRWNTSLYSRSSVEVRL